MKKILLIVFLISSIQASAQFAHQNINLLSTFDDVNVLPESVYGIRYQAVWAWVDSASGREYGIIGSTAGTYIIEVTDPANPVQRDYVASRQSDCIWHEYRTYGNYLYIISDDAGTSFQIADLSYLPDSVHVVYDDTDILEHAHTIFLDNDLLYIGSVSNSFNFEQMNVYSLTNPAHPTLLRKLGDDYPFIGAVHDMFVSNDTVFASCGNDGLFIFKYDRIGNSFSMLGSLTVYPDQGYNHSSVLSEDHSTLYMCDEVPAGMAVKVIDVSDISAPVVLGTFESNPGATPHNVYVWGDFLYIAYYQDGLYIYDISTPSTPVLSGYFDTHYQNPAGTYPSPSYQGCWGAYPELPSGTLLASDMQLGLFCLDASDAVSTPELSFANIRVFPNPAYDKIHIQSPIEMKGVYSIQNLEGKEIQSGFFNSSDEVIRLKNISAGIYFLKLNSGNTSYVKKIIINPVH
jgi:choice-of-anchor B domain-containing protein